MAVSCFGKSGFDCIRMYVHVCAYMCKRVLVYTCALATLVQLDHKF